jgi:hypothetical protein
MCDDAAMGDIILGVLVAAAGALFCFRGYLAMRVIIPIWGALTGFFLGAGLVSALGGDGFLGTAAGWAVGVLVAIVFGLIAYLYYEVSVILVMLSIGFTLGTTVMAALGVDWSWVIIVVGIVVAVLLALIAIAADLPTGILVVLTTLAGASAIMVGVAMVVNHTSSSRFGDDVVGAIGAKWWWWLIYAALVIAGLVAQVRVVGRLRQSMRDAWTEAGGRQLRGS